MGLLLIHGCLAFLAVACSKGIRSRDGVNIGPTCNLDKATFGKGKLGVNLNAIEKLETYKLNSVFI